MGYTCNGICENLQTHSVTTSKKYQNGQKRCTLCDVFLETDSLRCPCCNILLRTRPRKGYSFEN